MTTGLQIVSKQLYTVINMKIMIQWEINSAVKQL